MDSSLFDDCSLGNGEPGGRKSLGQGNEKPSKKRKGRKSLAFGMCLSHSRLFFTKPNKKGNGRNSLGHGNGKTSKKAKKSLGSASQGSYLPADDPRVVSMWRSCYFHDHNLCIRSNRQKPVEELTFNEAMLQAIGAWKDIDLDAGFDDDSETET